MLYAISTKLCKFCFETYKQITRYVETRAGSKEDISLSIIQQTIYNKADEILEIPESSMWEGCLKTLKSLTNELNTTHERISNETKTQKITIGVSPWTQRASDMKAEIVINHDMERKLQQHSDEILKLIKDVKLKDQALQEAHVKIELLEKRMETVKKQAEQIQMLEETLSKSQQQEQMYSEAIDNLQAEYDNLEQEHIKLKKEIAQKEEKRLSASKKAELFIEDATLMNSENEENNLDVHNLNSQLESLKCAIRFLRAENAHLKESDVLKTLHMDYTARKTLLPPTPPLTDDEGDEEDEEYENKEPDFKSMVRSVLQETRTLVKDVRLATATTKIVQLSPERRGGKWQRKKNLPDYQYQMQQSVLYTLKRRCESLKEKMKHIQNNERYAKWSQKSALAEKEHNKKLMKAFAKIHFPATAIVTEPKRHIQLESFKEFEKIHNLFIQ
ncbi:Putative Dynactin 1 [Rhizopus microsporus]|nr:Putative Dynactin 1 [Rhizopus microsporus]